MVRASLDGWCTPALALAAGSAAFQAPAAHDTIGLAGIDNGIYAAREQYLNAGGLGILVGDGRLPHPGPEQILETYYSLAVLHDAHLTLDYQWVDHPAFNRDREPVSIIAVRLHAQF